MPGPGAIASKTAAVRKRKTRVKSSMSCVPTLKPLFPEPGFEFHERFHARILALAVGAGHVKKHRLHAGIACTHVVDRIHVSHIKALSRLGLHRAQGRCENRGMRLFAPYNA